MCKLSWRDRKRRADYASSWSNGDLCQVGREILAVRYYALRLHSPSDALSLTEVSKQRRCLFGYGIHSLPQWLDKGERIDPREFSRNSPCLGATI